MRKQVSAVDRLRSLPNVFRGADLTVRFGWSSKTASQYLYLWKDRGLVAALGGHSDVFANLLKSEHPNWEQALLLIHPSALVVGIEALRRAGWTTQIPAAPTVAVEDAEPKYSIQHIAVERKSKQWMLAVQRGCQFASGGQIRFLRPAWALADLIKSEGWGVCGLQPDDIDWDAVTPKDEVDWGQAIKAIGLTAPSLKKLSLTHQMA